MNGNDGTEHRFQLRGVAEKPLAQDHIVLHTQAKTRYQHFIRVNILILYWDLLGLSCYYFSL